VIINLNFKELLKPVHFLLALIALLLFLNFFLSRTEPPVIKRQEIKVQNFDNSYRGEEKLRNFLTAYTNGGWKLVNIYQVNNFVVFVFEI
jgi:hypothetical protein